MVIPLYQAGLQLDAGLLWNTVAWPLALGAIFAGLAAATGKRASALGAVAALMILGVYVLLEGWPTFPPAASKAKLAYLILLGAVAVLFARRVPAVLVTAIALIAAFVWLGWNKLTGGALELSTAAMLAPVVTATIATPSLTTRANEAFLWPAALLCYAIGAAILSGPGLGAFVGFTQVMGAFAAWIGGYLLVLYALLLIGRDGEAMSQSALQIALIAFVMASLVIGLFAPGINLTAFAVLSLTLLVPAIAPRCTGVPRLLRPFAFGLMTAVPAAVSVLIALQQRG